MGIFDPKKEIADVVRERQNHMKKKKIRRKKRLLVVLCTFFLLLMTAVVGVVLFLLPYSRATMDMSLLTLNEESNPARLYAADPEAKGGGEFRYHLLDEGLPMEIHQQIPVTYEDVPEDLINAFVAIEDKRFFTHEGVDFKRTAHAVWDYLIHRGNASFGGSTITQQVVKNLTGNRDRTPERKLTEMFTALDLERRADKRKILEVYLNIINLGSGCMGVGAASACYFQKQPSELSLAECAALAAITNRPTLYNPRTHPEENRQRREIILREMRDQGYIDDVRYAEAMSETPVICDAPSSATTVTSWYTEMVISDVVRDLQERLDYSYERAMLLLSSGGLRIETSMDETLQEILTSYYETIGHFPVGTDGRPQSAAVIMDPYTGDILAVAGAIGKKDGYYLQNYATQTRRPAGSAIKPLSVYTPALKDGVITWSSIFEDVPLEELNGRPWPQNADGLYRGRVTVRDSVSHSLNTVAVEILRRVGMERSFDFLHDTLRLSELLPPTAENVGDMTIASLALGQNSVGVTVRGLTGGYTIFSEGVYHPPISYRRVLDEKGRVLMENSTTGERVLSPAEACVMTKLLSSVTSDGTAAGLLLTDEMGIPSAGKTGTTQNNCDRWFVGYTPKLLCGVWMGYDYPAPLDGIIGNPSIDIWDDVMMACEKIYRGVDRRSSFEVCDGVVPVKLCPLTGEIATPDCYDALGDLHPPMVGWFVEGTEPADCCHLHFSVWQEMSTQATDIEDKTEGEEDASPQTEPTNETLALSPNF